MSTLLVDPPSHSTGDKDFSGGFAFPEAPTDLPAWFQELRETGWKGFCSTAFPSRLQEAWRFSNTTAFSNLSGFAAQYSYSKSRDFYLEHSVATTPDSKRIIFANNTLVASECSDLPEGVLALPLTDALQSAGELVRKYFLSQPVELGSHKFALLHQAAVAGGVLIFVPEGMKLSQPVEIFYWVEGKDTAVFPHTLVVCGENSSVTVVDHFLSADGERAFCCGVNDLHVQSGASLNYFALQNWSSQTHAFHINSTVVHENGSSCALAANLGAALLRGESLSRLKGEGARSVMLSANPVEGSRFVDQRTLQCHDAPGAFSDLLYHNSLDDTARTIFAGLIQVAEGAHRTDAYQKVRNLILSDDAEANSMPGLEILADNVRCTHGATSGEISEDELFYMQARGIPVSIGRRMILMGFFEALLERVDDHATREFFSIAIRKHLGLEL